jgi:hypothetical protein
MFINEVYSVRATSQFFTFTQFLFCSEICHCTELTWGVEEQVLSDPAQRAVYDEIHGYTATAINPFFDDSAPKDQVFVDEFTCIGICSSVVNISFSFGS